MSQNKVEYFKEDGEGCLYLSGDRQKTAELTICPVAQRNRPTSEDRIDIAYIIHMEGTDFFQWYGRKSDGRFHHIGKLLVLTRAGAVTYAKSGGKVLRIAGNKAWLTLEPI